MALRPVAVVSDPAWVLDIKQKVTDLAEKNTIDWEEWSRVLFFLDQEDASTYLNTMRMIVNNANAFKTYLTRLVDDTKRAQVDPIYRNVMREIYENMMSEEDGDIEEGYFRVSPNVGNVATSSGYTGLVAAIARMSPAVQLELVESLARLPFVAPTTVGLVNNAVGVTNALGRRLAPVALAGLYLGYEAVMNLRRWWKSEITGKRCAKNVIDTLSSLAAGVAGGFGGAAIGGLFGPIGSVVGGVAGSIFSSSVASALADRLTRSIFDLPKEEAVENAYNYFRLSHRCSNAEINTAYKQKCLQHHPDKGGSQEEFVVVQCHMACIKMSRGEL